MMHLSFASFVLMMVVGSIIGINIESSYVSAFYSSSFASDTRMENSVTFFSPLLRHRQHHHHHHHGRLDHRRRFAVAVKDQQQGNKGDNAPISSPSSSSTIFSRRKFAHQNFAAACCGLVLTPFTSSAVASATSVSVSGDDILTKTASDPSLGPLGPLIGTWTGNS